MYKEIHPTISSNILQLIEEKLRCCNWPRGGETALDGVTLGRVLAGVSRREPNGGLWLGFMSQASAGELKMLLVLDRGIGVRLAACGLEVFP